MSTPSSSFIDPASLSLPSPSSAASPSPAPLEPSRKRPRSETTHEDRKEARAHRNRIAAQNSRDRRKAQFSYLERRVAELEEENRQLRAGAGLPNTKAEDAEREKERARERENEELRERIKTLEKGWDAVVKALAAQGLPTGIPTPPNSSPAPPNTTTTTTTTTTETPSTQPPTTGFPVLVPPPPVYPLSPAPSSHSSIFADESTEYESTRHLAAGGLAPSSPQLDAIPSSEVQVDDATMEDLLREILAPSPTFPPASLPMDSQPSSTETPAQIEHTDLAGEAEMQRLLDMLPDVRQECVDSMGALVEFPSALDLGWEFESEHGVSQSSNSIGVF